MHAAGSTSTICVSLTYASLAHIGYRMITLQTVVEMESFLKRARAIMSDGERLGIVSFLAANPEAGVALGGGLRKVRVAREGGWLSHALCVRRQRYAPVFDDRVRQEREG
jgi:hypothetical protein